MRIVPRVCTSVLSLTLGAPAQRGLQYLVCLSVCLSVCFPYSGSTCDEKYNERYHRVLSISFAAILTLLARSANNLIKYTHATLVTRSLESAAARCSLSAAEFRNRESVVLFTDRH